MTNVIHVMADDLVWDVLAGMPYLATRPEGSWVEFPQSINTTPLCGPSRVTAHTGVGSWTHGCANNVATGVAVDAGWNPNVMLGRSLQNAGVSTAFVGKYINGYPWSALSGTVAYVPEGWDRWRAVKAENYYSYKVVNEDGSETTYGGDSNPANYVTDVEAGYVADFAATLPEPFFLFWAAKAPHEGTSPDFPPAPRHAEAEVTLERRANFNEADVSDKPSWLQDRYPAPLDTSTLTEYDEEHENVLRMALSFDEGIEDLIAALQTRGILEDTIIIFSGDNSNLFGEHRHRSKGVPYEEALGMHLWVRYPGHAGGVNSALVGNLDIAPTVCDVLGARMRYAADGMSILPVLSGAVAPENFRRELLIWRVEESPRQFGVGTYRGIRTHSGMKYVEHLTDNEQEMYDLTEDPYELVNIAADPARAAERAQLAARLDRIAPA